MPAVRAAVVFAVCAALAGCDQLDSEKAIAPAAVRDAVQSGLGVELSEAPTVDSVASLTDVAAIYTLRGVNDRVFIVVFDSRDATGQLTGPTRRSNGEVVTVRNVVAVYDHDHGTVSRLAQLRSALRSADRSAA